MFQTRRRSVQPFILIHLLSINSFTAKVAFMHPKKIVQSKLRSRLAKAASELGLHYFLFHLAKTRKFTNIVDLLYSFL